MMKYFLSFFFFFSFLVAQEPNIEKELVQKGKTFLAPFHEELKKKHDLELIFADWSASYRHFFLLGTSYKTYKELSLEEGQKLIKAVAQELKTRLESNQEMMKYIKTAPNSEDMRICIQIHDPKTNEFVKGKKLAFITLINKEIFYESVNESGKGFDLILKEDSTF